MQQRRYWTRRTSGEEISIVSAAACGRRSRRSHVDPATRGDVVDRLDDELSALELGRSSARGQSTRYALDHEGIELGDRCVELADVMRIRLASAFGAQVCEVTLRSGVSNTIVNDAREHLGAYRQFVTALHAELLSRPDVTFVRGSWFLVGGNAAIAVIAILAAIAFSKNWLPAPAWVADKVDLIIGTGFASLVLGPRVAWRSRPRPYDPLHVPDALLG